MSEYAIVIGLRWVVVVVFQLPLLVSCLSTISAAFSLMIYSLRKVAAFARKTSRNRNANGTFAVEDHIIPSNSSGRRRGRPPKTAN